ncbi:MAG: hypothetical protein WCT77_02970 [Bacteroidota bacterium]|jgi:hypothetical protein
MNLHKEFIEDTNQLPAYIDWLETKVENKRVAKAVDEINKTPKHFKIRNYETEIDYDNQNLNYQVRVDFPRLLSLNERKQVEDVINYWSKLPFVSVEGNDGIQWITNIGNYAIIDIDLTKSASDDYMAHEILEKLAEWIWQGTPLRKKTHDRKYDGVIKPLKVSADSP